MTVSGDLTNMEKVYISRFIQMKSTIQELQIMENRSHKIEDILKKVAD